mmetsp:Transcript_18564/g.54549  ORF Transcript_18564/g.54549 Transcript_18564/m.54549 type:complete len:297 (+) Transcript_18564:35-925(+)
MEVLGAQAPRALQPTPVPPRTACGWRPRTAVRTPAISIRRPTSAPVSDLLHEPHATLCARLAHGVPREPRWQARWQPEPYRRSFSTPCQPYGAPLATPALGVQPAVLHVHMMRPSSAMPAPRSPSRLVARANSDKQVLEARLRRLREARQEDAGVQAVERLRRARARALEVAAAGAATVEAAQTWSLLVTPPSGDASREGFVPHGSEGLMGHEPGSPLSAYLAAAQMAEQEARRSSAYVPTHGWTDESQDNSQADDLDGPPKAPPSTEAPDGPASLSNGEGVQSSPRGGIRGWSLT